MLDDSSSEARLRLSEVRPSDEGEYKCEITFLDITKECPVVQLVKLTTLGEHFVTNIVGSFYYFCQIMFMLLKFGKKLSLPQHFI